MKKCLYNQNFYNQMVLKQIGSNVRLQKNVRLQTILRYYEMHITKKEFIKFLNS